MGLYKVVVIKPSLLIQSKILTQGILTSEETSSQCCEIITRDVVGEVNLEKISNGPLPKTGNIIDATPAWRTIVFKGLFEVFLCVEEEGELKDKLKFRIPISETIIMTIPGRIKLRYYCTIFCISDVRNKMLNVVSLLPGTNNWVKIVWFMKFSGIATKKCRFAVSRKLYQRCKKHSVIQECLLQRCSWKNIPERLCQKPLVCA